MDKIWVTGGTGFLGKSLTKNLMDKYAILSTGREECDLMCSDQIKYYVRYHKPDVVVHLAAKVGGILANKNSPGEFIYDNLMMGTNLIEQCRIYHVPKVVLIGTICMFPKFTPVPFKEEDIWNGYPEETNAPYGIAKKTLIEMGNAYRKQYGMNIISLIPTNLFGPEDNFDDKTSHVIPALIKKVLTAKTNKSKYIEVWGTGEVSREFLYVTDCARAIRLAIEKYNEVASLNLGTGKEIKIKDLVVLICKLCGYTGEIRYNNSYPDGQPRRCVDISRSLHYLGNYNTVEFEQGLLNTINWYKYGGKDV